MRKIVYFGGKKFYNIVPNLVLACMGIILLLVMAGFSSAVNVFAPTSDTVVLDLSRQNDPGPTTAQALEEKKIKEAVANYLKDYLNNAGIRVVLNQDSQLGLEQKVSMVQQTGADFWINLLVNVKQGPAVSGVKIFYPKGSEKGKLLALQIQGELKALKTGQSGAAKPEEFPLPDQQVAALVIDLGTSTKSAEGQKLEQQRYQQQLAQAIAKGIVKSLHRP